MTVGTTLPRTQGTVVIHVKAEQYGRRSQYPSIKLCQYFCSVDDCPPLASSGGRRIVAVASAETAAVPPLPPTPSLLDEFHTAASYTTATPAGRPLCPRGFE